MNPLDNSQPISLQQQAILLEKVHQAEYREPELATDLLGAGLWIGYALLALVWMRSVAQRRKLRWLVAVSRRIVVPALARQTVRGLAIVTRQRERAAIFAKPAAART